jgi:hypothetical protein
MQRLRLRLPPQDRFLPAVTTNRDRVFRAAEDLVSLYLGHQGALRLAESLSFTGLFESKLIFRAPLRRAVLDEELQDA